MLNSGIGLYFVVKQIILKLYVLF